MKFLVKYKFHLLILFCLVAAYFVIRLPNLTLQPIFADEAIYIRWAQIMKSEPTLRFVSLQDGKTPFFMWSMTPLFKIFDDPLFAGRFLSVMSGAGTLLGVFFLGWRLFNTRAALWASLLYVITPYTVFFDRMALVDSMLATCTIWAIYFAIWLLKMPRLDLAMILGYFLGIALLIKTPAMTNILSLPLTLIGFDFKNAQKKDLLKLLLFWFVALVIALGIYSVLRLGPGFNQLSSRNADYIFTLKELEGRPLDPFIPHLHDVTEWFAKLITLTTLLFIAAGLIFVVIQRNRRAWAVIAWIAVPLFLEMAFLKTFTARYILMTIPPLLIMAGFGADQVLEKLKLNYKLASLAALLVVLPLPLYTDYLLITSLAEANLPRNERKGYLEDWTAGYGLKDIASYLIEQNNKEKIAVGVDGYFGTLPEGLYIYMDKAGIPIIGSNATISAGLRELSQKRPTYFVANGERFSALEKTQMIKVYPKTKALEASSEKAIILYKLVP